MYNDNLQNWSSVCLKSFQIQDYLETFYFKNVLYVLYLYPFDITSYQNFICLPFSIVVLKKKNFYELFKTIDQFYNCN